MMEWCLKKLASSQIQRSIFYHQGGKLEPWMMDGSTTQSKTLSYCIINYYWNFGFKVIPCNFIERAKLSCLLRFVDI